MIRSKAEREGIPHYRIAVELGWSPAKLSLLMGGKRAATSQDRKKLAEYLGAPKKWLFDLDPPLPSEEEKRRKRSAGGLARAAKMTPEERSESARQAVLSRWANRAARLVTKNV